VTNTQLVNMDCLSTMRVVLTPEADREEPPTHNREGDGTQGRRRGRRRGMRRTTRPSEEHRAKTPEEAVDQRGWNTYCYMLLGPCHRCDLPLRFSAVPSCHSAPVFLSSHALHLYFPAPVPVPLRVVRCCPIEDKHGSGAAASNSFSLHFSRHHQDHQSSPIRDLLARCLLLLLRRISHSSATTIRPYLRALPCLETFPAMERMPSHHVRLRITVA